jgi:hypothetical protein
MPRTCHLFPHRLLRVLPLLVGLCSWVVAEAQMVQQKHLLTSLGGGGGILSLFSSEDSLRSTGMASSAARFSASYGLGRRWSIGIHWDRVGTVVHPALQRMRATTYMLEGSYRPFNGRQACLEVNLALGASIAVLRPEDRLLPFTARGGVIAGGLRYMHLLNNTVGLFAALDHCYSGPQVVEFEEEPLQALPATTFTVSWQAQRLTGGLFLRF